MYKQLLRNGDVVSAAVLAALGVYIALEASHWTYSGDDGPGPAFFPVWYGIAMVVLSLVLMVHTIVRPPAAGAPVDWPGIGRALGTWALFAICAALMMWLGFFVSFALLAFTMIAVVFRQPVVIAVIAAVVAAAGFYLVFPLALGVALPAGVFGF